jgi:hypothetical protein
VRKLPYAEIVNDRERDGRQLRQGRLPGAIDRSLRDFLEQRVGLAVDDTIALLDRGAADRLREMALPVPGGPRKNASSRDWMKRAVATSKMSAPFIFLLKSKSKSSSERPESRKLASLCRRVSRRSSRRRSSSETSVAIRSKGRQPRSICLHKYDDVFLLTD